MSKLRLKFIGAVALLGGLALSGCTTNGIVNQQTRTQIEELTDEGERLIQEIDDAKTAKARVVDRLNQSLMELENEIQAQYGQRNVHLSKVKEGIKLTILDRILFDSGSAQIKAGGQAILERVAQTLNTTDKEIQITGFTDNQPIKHTKHLYKNNWDLSMHRALSVLHLFEEQGLASERMFAVGYGANRPVAGNETKEGRQSNRRVEIVLLDNVHRT